MFEGPCEGPLVALLGELIDAIEAEMDIVDAHLVAIAVEAGGGAVLTSDTDDLERLAAPYPHLRISGV